MLGLLPQIHCSRRWERSMPSWLSAGWTLYSPCRIATVNICFHWARSCLTIRKTKLPENQSAAPAWISGKYLLSSVLVENFLLKRFIIGDFGNLRFPMLAHSLQTVFQTIIIAVYTKVSSLYKIRASLQFRRHFNSDVISNCICILLIRAARSGVAKYSVKKPRSSWL